MNISDLLQIIIEWIIITIGVLGGLILALVIIYCIARLVSLAIMLTITNQNKKEKRHGKKEV